MSRITLIILQLVYLLWAECAFAQYPLKIVEGEKFIVDLKYNSETNFLGQNLYKKYNVSKCYVHSDLYNKLKSAEPKLQKLKLKLIFWDCYRPLAVQKEMWKIKPDSHYVANPKTGSAHNRGTAIDVTLADVNEKPLDMTTSFDDFTPKAAPSYKCGPPEAQKCKNRDTLKTLMKDIGLQPINSEWWHYQLHNSHKYPLIDLKPITYE